MKKAIIYVLVPSILFFVSCGGTENNGDSTTDENNLAIDTANVEDSAVVQYTYADFNAYLTRTAPLFQNIDSLEAQFHLMKADFTQEEKDKAFNDILAFMYQFDVADEDVQWEREDQDMEMDAVYGVYGFVVGADEGMFYIMPSFRMLEEKYGADLSEDLQNFIAFQKLSNKPMFSDAGLIISFGEYGDMLVKMEKMLRSNTQSEYFKDMLASFRGYLWTYLWGLDNTPITTWEEPKKLDPEVEAAYNKAMNTSDSKMKNILEPHIKLLEEMNYNVPYEEQKVPTDDELKKLLQL